MRSVWALAVKDIRLLLRDRSGTLFTFGVPILFAAFFGVVFSSDGEGSALPLSVVDDDDSELSRELIARLQAAEELDVAVTERAEAVDLVRQGERVAYVVIPEGFGDVVAEILEGETITLELGVDPARRAEAAMLEGMLQGYFFETLIDSFSDPDRLQPYVRTARVALELNPMATNTSLGSLLSELDAFLDTVPDADDEPAVSGQDEGEGEDTGGWMPLNIRSASITRDDHGPRSAYLISFPQGLIWGLISCTATFAISLVQERTRGTLVRLRTAPIARGHILGGKALACFLTALLLTVGLFILGGLLFDIRPDRPFLFLLSAVLVAYAFSGIMMLVSLFGRTERAVGGIGWTVMMVAAMFGGGMLPLFFMPEWMVTASHFSPVKWSILALEGPLWRGFGLVELLPSLAVLFGVGSACLVAGISAFRLTDNG